MYNVQWLHRWLLRTQKKIIDQFACNGNLTVKVGLTRNLRNLKVKVLKSHLQCLNTYFSKCFSIILRYTSSRSALAFDNSLKSPLQWSCIVNLAARWIFRLCTFRGEIAVACEVVEYVFLDFFWWDCLPFHPCARCSWRTGGKMHLLKSQRCTYFFIVYSVACWLFEIF